MTRTEEFEDLRPLLFAIAYRILGSVTEAEDAVQDTWLRYAASPTRPASAKAFLSAVVTRISIDTPRSARVRREEYVGPRFPESLLTDPYENPERSAELADSLSMAALLLLERLTPLEPRSVDGHIIGRAEDWEVSGATNPMSHPRLGPWLRGERGPHDGPVPGGREDGHE